MVSEKNLKIVGIPAEKKRARMIWNIQLSALLEAALLISGFFLWDYFLGNGERFSAVNVNLFWIPIILIAAQYGTPAAVMTTIFTTAALYADNFPAQAGGEDLYSYGWRVCNLPLQWFCAAIVIGEINVRHRHGRAQAEHELAIARKREDTMVKAYRNLEAKKEEHERELAALVGTPAAVLSALSIIDPREPAQALIRSRELVELIIRPQKSSLFMLGEKGLELTSSWGWQDSHEFQRTFDPQSPLYRAIVKEKKFLTVSNRKDAEILSEQGVLASPILDSFHNNIIGMLKIEMTDPARLTVGSVAAFRLLGNWLGTVYGSALHIQALEYSQKPHRPLEVPTQDAGLLFMSKPIVEDKANN